MPSEISRGELKDQERARWEVNTALQGVLRRQSLTCISPNYN